MALIYAGSQRDVPQVISLSVDYRYQHGGGVRWWYKVIGVNLHATPHLGLVMIQGHTSTLLALTLDRATRRHKHVDFNKFPCQYICINSISILETLYRMSVTRNIPGYVLFPL